VAQLDPVVVDDAAVSPMRALTTLAAAAVLAACGSGAPPQPQADHPVWLLATLGSPEAAWAAAQRADQPLLIVGQAIYGLPSACVPKRFYSQQDAARLTGSQADQRLLASGMDDRRMGSAADQRALGSAADARRLGSAADGRQMGAQADGRQLGSAQDQRVLGAANDQRLTGASQDQRSFGGDERGRSFDSDAVRREFGAVETALRCRLLAGSDALWITGAGTRQGYVFSARLRGALDGVHLN